jgi:hypothetical protein
MRSLKVLLTAAATATALLASARPASAVLAAPGNFAAPGGCHAVRTPTGWKVVCSSGGSSPGQPPGGGGKGGGGGGQCTLSALPPGYPVPSRAPAGEKWMWMSCQTVEQAGLVLVATGSTTRNPGVTPQQLEQFALADLHVPAPAPQTAPPRGDRGLVGLPEWIWMPPGNWHPVTARVSVGPVWAEVTATPVAIAVSPGGGLPGVTCHGPGTAYDPGRAAGEQHTSCSVTYPQSSDLQPGHQFQASVTVTWTAAWTGSGGTGGAITPPLRETTTFGVRVAEGQAVVTGSGQ